MQLILMEMEPLNMKNGWNFGNQLKKLDIVKKKLKMRYLLLRACLFYQIEALSKGQSWVKFNQVPLKLDNQKKKDMKHVN